MPPAQARRLLSARVFQVWQIYPMNLRICLKRFFCWKRKRAPEATDPRGITSQTHPVKLDKLAAVIQLRLGWAGFARPLVGNSTIANARYVGMLCLEAGETPDSSF